MPEGEERVRELMHEVTAIAGGLGYEIEDEYVEFQMYTANTSNSMTRPVLPVMLCI
jgi:ketopantoate reductase